MKKAVILMSGGIDSTVTAHIARKEMGPKAELYALSFLYGQRHAKELECAKFQAEAVKAKSHKFVEVPINQITSSSLLYDSEGKAMEEIPTEEVIEGIPSTWVPQRNSIFLAMAFSYAELLGADFIYTGFNAVDYSGYPDCRPEFVKAIQMALNLASKRFVEDGRGMSIMTPIMKDNKVVIIQKGLVMGVDFTHTWSCYSGGNEPCHTCPSCRIREEAFKEACK